MTFYELLKKFSIEELWYILQNRHDVSGKPIKAGRLFGLYKSAYAELIALHAENATANNVLVCEFTIEGEDGGAPDSWIHCHMLSPDKSDSGEMQSFAIDFIPWNELIDCKVSDDSLAKLGEFVCAAELLWEITFYGYSKAKVDEEAEKLSRLADDVASGNAKTHPINPDDWKPNEEEAIEEEKAIAEWIARAPDKVKNIVFGFYAAAVCGRDEDVDDITVQETLRRLKEVLDESSAQELCNDEYVRLVRFMVSELDYDNKYLLLSRMFDG